MRIIKNQPSLLQFKTECFQFKFMRFQFKPKLFNLYLTLQIFSCLALLKFIDCLTFIWY